MFSELLFQGTPLEGCFCYYHQEAGSIFHDQLIEKQQLTALLVSFPNHMQNSEKEPLFCFCSINTIHPSMSLYSSTDTPKKALKISKKPELCRDLVN